MLFDLDNTIIKEHIKQAEFGIERESLRINSDGTLAQTPHPFESHKNIDRDFCENQIEFISDVFNKPEQVNEQLWELQRLVNGKLKENGEFLWSFSNPPRISGENEIPVAEYTFNVTGDETEYRYVFKNQVYLADCTVTVEYERVDITDLDVTMMYEMTARKYFKELDPKAHEGGVSFDLMF